MRRSLHAAALLALAAAASPARAGPEVALRVGVAPALGEATGDLPMSEAMRLQFPLQLDAGWRRGPLAAGAYLSWAVAAGPRCDAGVTCSASIWRTGFAGTWHFPVPSRARPWAGAGGGWEWAASSRRNGGTIETTWSGWELFAQGGVEWRVARRIALGPYATVAAGRYTRYGVETPVESGAAAVLRPAFHFWLHAGVRARLALEEEG